ncbi:MAG: phosphoribosylformylglycinamidine synthase I [Elusimicrobia bacterium RIFCSPLOWO2_02_FULL_39_32]|nr:MAG: phosphoribosylformylglycinamidine synthase I [Elusimicrobia bacterium GWA2_38_7]OGR80641.1 MAG: phosphoribosylformylglycinamidine synthase I [Elusimicrobia bacterium RIFCSPHIGHO2_02_FULL_39_36]OGR91490.1 MAG: phosphoribosylformylglycinamidine synthase I [Elusimicrobia bacterium RIFCSPLOWO2_02_FULL_39_32]OGS00745.1 MAG: phosphoribosylformylglycinamidine synthase I [Elusimicrobia bacterium RIFCSPLOWO2_12_FULL_39_28]
MSVKALVLRSVGTNCDLETRQALKSAGAKVDVLHLNQILQKPEQLLAFSILVIPGGFSYGDDIAAGKILANELKFKIGAQLQQMARLGHLIIGICNGFQVLVKTGLLPGYEDFSFQQNSTLTQNLSGRFQCEWVALKRENSCAQYLKGIPLHFELPIAHGEGNFVTKDLKILQEIEKNKQVVFRYEGKNPNGSMNAIAGICNQKGNVLGLMPHPERYITQFQHPAWTKLKLKVKTPGFLFWKGAVDFVKR